jgi:RNase adaptor protein for sRNA GlmZ degradation
VRQIVVTSFGYGHLAAGEATPEADVTVDVREWLSDPISDPAVRELNGWSPEVRARVLATVGAFELAQRVAAVAETLLTLSVASRRTVRVAVGCSGGRHRSVVLAGRIADLLGAEGWGVEVEHLHVGLPVIRQLPATQEATP